MAQCSKSNCKKVATKDGLCADHLRLKQQDEQKQAAQKKQMEKQAAEAKEKEAARLLVIKKNEEAKVGKAKRAAELATLWNGQVNTIVNEVLALRKKPGYAKANCGSNPGVEDIEGGSGNPVKFTVPSPNPFGVTSADVFAKMKNFKSSDSSGAKFDYNGIFVHCH